MKSILRLLTVSLIAAPLCGTALAQEQKLYVEPLVGISSFKLSTGAFTDNLITRVQPANTGPALNPGLLPNVITITGRDTSSQAYGVRLGYQIHPFIAIEASYVDAGTPVVRGVGTIWTAPAGSTNQSFTSANAVQGNTLGDFAFSTSLHTREYNFGVTGRYTFMDRFGVVGRFGLNASVSEWGKNISATPLPAAVNPALASTNPLIDSATINAKNIYMAVRDNFNDQDRGTDWFYGAGLSFNLNDRWTLNGTVDQFSGRQRALVTAFSGKFSF